MSIVRGTPVKPVTALAIEHLITVALGEETASGQGSLCARRLSGGEIVLSPAAATLIALRLKKLRDGKS